MNRYYDDYDKCWYEMGNKKNEYNGRSKDIPDKAFVVLTDMDMPDSCTACRYWGLDMRTLEKGICDITGHIVKLSEENDKCRLYDCPLESFNELIDIIENHPAMQRLDSVDKDDLIDSIWHYCLYLLQISVERRNHSAFGGVTIPH